MGDPLIKELEEWGPDLIHVHSEGATYYIARRIGKHCDVPIVMTCHTDYEYFVFGKLRFLPPLKALSSIVGGILYRPAAMVMVPSKKATGFPYLHNLKDRLIVIPNGMELEKYQKHLSDEDRRAFRASLGIDDRSKVLVTVTRLSKEKNNKELISYLPELLEKNPDVVLLIVGDGPDRAHLEKLTKILGLSNHVIFVGRVPMDDVWHYYAAGDVFVSASTFEVHSMSYLEALASGLPLLCRADDALIGVLEDGKNGHAYHSQSEFVDYACRILDDDQLREEMGQNSLLRATSYSSDAYAHNMLKVYESALNGRNVEKRCNSR